MLNPDRDCPRCPRLVDFREAQRRAHPDWHNAPVPTFGDIQNARLLIVGLAPGLQGANRTGRPFTGDYAGTLLYDTLSARGFANSAFDARPDDGLVLHYAAVTNAVRCVPPQNKPTGQEIKSCAPFLSATIAAMPSLSVVLALGRIAHDAVLRAYGARLSAYPFRHGAIHAIESAPMIADSYHPSRYNVNTGVLDAAMFDAVIAAIRARITAAPSA
ncbi:uracil-DNA glycosylase [Acuticoccus kandeliae]|uniref:uracil-DNA glycosylase n=1 Tax=Acuticoccus kandeliae TaxID=2073160 RepID=UPI000D3E4643|nr:uracil-DNA glycosylase [Acuticoccus kandeliae]